MNYLITLVCAVLAFNSVHAEDACCTQIEVPADCQCNVRRLKGVEEVIPEAPRVLAGECAPGIQFCADVPWAVPHNGIYYAYAAPVAGKTHGGLYGVTSPPYGWRFPTVDEIWNRPPLAAFGANGCYRFSQNSPTFKCLCASHIFGTTYQHCDFGDYQAGYVNRMWWELEQRGYPMSHPNGELLYVHDPDLPAIECGSDISANTDAGQCSAVVDVSGGASSPQGLPISNDAPAVFPLGSTVVTYTAGAETCSITVTVSDSEAPTVLGVTVSRDKLWPPNHKFQTVSANVVTADNCPDSNVQCVINGVTSSEESQWEDLEGGPYCGLGGAVFDIVGDLDVNLCSERNGNGNGRIYTVSGSCNDGNNNEQSAFSAQVFVPHSLGKGKK